MNCPHCQRVLYSRQHKVCGFCGGKLPAELRLSKAEVAALKAEQKEIAERRAVAKEKEEEERKENARRRRRSSPGMMPPGGMPGMM